MVMIQLTEKQTKYLPAVLWLIKEGPRCSGRTTLLAVAYIIAASEHGQFIEVRDHHPHHRADQELTSIIAQIINEMNRGRPPEEHMKLDVDGTRIRIRGGYDGLKAQFRTEDDGPIGIDNPYLREFKQPKSLR